MNEPNQPERDLRSIERLIEERQHDWPADLVVAAKRAHIAFFILARNSVADLETMKNLRENHPEMIAPDHVTSWEHMLKVIADFGRLYAEWQAHVASKGA